MCMLLIGVYGREYLETIVFGICSKSEVTLLLRGGHAWVFFREMRQGFQDLEKQTP